MNAQEVRDNLNAALNQHRALTQVSAMLDEIVSFEQAATEARDARDKAIRERDAAKAAMANATAELAGAKSSLAETVASVQSITQAAAEKADAITMTPA